MYYRRKHQGSALEDADGDWVGLGEGGRGEVQANERWTATAVVSILAEAAIPV